ncbi:hypothetical protein, conserved [Leishmania tarentolae]|uniref:Uncharacterized protein n=1 Tax=Leishmania tarentolae TaxID=5689 RepID=A0A640KAB4_LEITA|nr:hypothetical protein, conserved [Leishmania tarentolae]
MFVFLFKPMLSENSGMIDSGAANREVVLEKKLAAEVAKRHEAERTAEDLRRQVELLKEELSVLRQSCEPEKGSNACRGSVHEEAGVLPDLGKDCTGNRDSGSKAENNRLRQTVKRQNALIDVLKRQKVLLEASTAINISIRDFNKQLEIHKV